MSCAAATHMMTCGAQNHPTTRWQLIQAPMSAAANHPAATHELRRCQSTHEMTRCQNHPTMTCCQNSANGSSSSRQRTVDLLVDLSTKA